MRIQATLLLSLCPLLLQAQSSTWHLDSLKGNAAVVLFKPDSARVQKEGTLLSFRIHRQPPVVRLADKKVNEQVLQLLGLSAEPINQQYGPDPMDLLPTEKLLTAASRDSNSKLVLNGSSSGEVVTGVPGTDAGDYAPEEPVGDAAPAEKSTNPWLYAGIAGVLAFLLGWLAGRVKKEKPAPAAAEAPGTEREEDKAALAALQQKTNNLQQQAAQLRQELEQLNAADQRYFNAVFEQLLLPIQESLEQNKKQHLLAQLVTATAILNSITRHKLGKKGQYDDANLRLLTGTAAQDAGAPILTGATPPDQIPHHLRGLLALLNENGISSLGDVVVQGYRFQDLS